MIKKYGIATKILFFVLLLNPVFAQSMCVAPPEGLTHWWSGDFNGKDLAGDKNVSPRNGAKYANGYVSGAFSLDGINDLFVSEPLTTTSSFTLEAWVKLQSKGTTNWRVNQGIVSQYAGGSGPYFIWEASPNLTSINLWDSTWGSAGMNIANKWSHLAVIRQPGVGKKFYINGQLVANRPIGRYSPLHRSVLIGYGGDHSRFSKGLIDEVSYYNRALTTEEIHSVFQAGTSGKCNGPSDSQPPAFLARSINYDAGSTTINGSVELDESGTVTVRASNETNTSVLNTTSSPTTSNEPFEADFQLPLDVGNLPSIVRVDLNATDDAGNAATGQALLLDTSVSSSTLSDPEQSVNIRIEGSIVDLT